MVNVTIKDHGDDSWAVVVERPNRSGRVIETQHCGSVFEALAMVAEALGVSPSDIQPKTA